MTKSEKEIQHFLSIWNYTARRIRSLEDKISAMTFSVTARYSLSQGRSIGKVSNAVENFYLQKDEKVHELVKLSNKVEAYKDAIKNAGLTDWEHEAVRCLQEGMKINEFAKEKGIYCSYAYKVKDRAIQKLDRYMKNNAK